MRGAPRMYGVVTVGERGQVVIPMGLRKAYHIAAGDKLVVFAKDRGPIALIPAEQFNKFADEVSKIAAKMKI